MWIDIIEAYAEALHVATTLRPAPARDSRRCPHDNDAAPFAPPTALHRIARWLVRGGRRAHPLAPTDLRGRR